MIVDIKVKMKDGTVFHYNNQGQAIKAARIASGLTQQAVAEAVGIIVETYQKYETGVRTPKDATLEKIAQALGIAVEVLMCTE